MESGYWNHFIIAEIVVHFDVVAIQEVREDLQALDKLIDILGSHCHIDPADEQSLRDLLPTIEKAALWYFKQFDTSITNSQQQYDKLTVSTSSPCFYRAMPVLKVILKIECQQ